MEQKNKKAFSTKVIIGFIVFCISMLALLFFPNNLNEGFNAMVSEAHPIIIDVGLLSTMSTSIIISVVVGRILERLGFTDAMMRLFLPIGRFLKVNCAVLIPAIYNILGDINAAGSIAGPILVKTGATNDEKKIAIFTMVQSEQSFSTFMLGLGCLTLCGARVFLVVVISIFLPLIFAPFIGRLIWRKTKAMEVDDLPTFTPDTPFLNGVFAAGQEGIYVLLHLVLPAFAVVFGFIGLLRYVGIWDYVNKALVSVLTFLNIDPETGILSIMASPTLAMSNLQATAASINPKWVIGSFVMAASGFPLSVILGQIPVIWAKSAEMQASEALKPALLGIVFRVLTSGFIATVLSGILLK